MKSETVCQCCGAAEEELHTCRQCEESVCDGCLVGPFMPPNTVIDHNLCKDCYEGMEQAREEM